MSYSKWSCLFRVWNSSPTTHDFSVAPAILVSLIRYPSLKCFAIKFRRWVISKWAPLSCNLNVYTLVLIPLDFSYYLACLFSLLQSTYCPVSTGNTTTLSRIHISHISAVMISFCLFVCPFAHFKSNPWQEKSYQEILWGTSKVKAQDIFVHALRAKVTLQWPRRQAVRSLTLLLQ